VDEAVRQLVRIGLDKVEAWISKDEALSEKSDLTASLTRITTAELAGVLEAHLEAAVLDVRGTGEYADSHVRGAVHVPYTRLAARLGEVPDTHPLYVHCGSGLRASFAVPYLASEGREVVHVDGAFGEIASDILAKATTADLSQ
jgi:hydroxyacylglutathione hydrolase